MPGRVGPLTGGDRRTGGLGPVRAAVDRLDRAAAAIARAAAWAAGALLLAMVGHVLLEIALRGVLARSTFVLDEFVGYGVAAVTFLAAGHAFQDDALIRVGLVLEATRRRPRLRRSIELAAAGMAVACVGFVAWYMAKSVLRHLDRGTVSETVARVPLWIPEGLMLLGLLVLVLRIAVYMLRVAAGGPLLADGDGDRGDGG